MILFFIVFKTIKDSIILKNDYNLSFIIFFHNFNISLKKHYLYFFVYKFFDEDFAQQYLLKFDKDK